MVDSARALSIQSALSVAWAIRPQDGFRRTLGTQTLILDQEPAFIRNKRGEIAGVDAWVRLFDSLGNEIPVDPHRRILNPPTVPRARLTYVPDLDVFGQPYERRVVGLPNPAEAFLEAVWDSIASAPNAKGWRTRGTVTTVYATAPGGTGEGYARSINATYATARTGGTLAAINDHYVGQWINAGTYYCLEGFVIFDTSGLPDGDAVSDVVLSLDGVYDGAGLNYTITAASSSYNGGAVVTADWVSGASLGALTAYATFDTTGYVATYNAFTSAGAAFNNAINKTGNTPIILYSNQHRDAAVPADDERIGFTDGDAAGTTTDPKLDITHVAAAVGGLAIPVLLRRR